MKHFVTLFPKARNIHLVKEIGQIPYHMQKQFGYKSTLVCHNRGNYSYLNEEVKGLRVHFLEDNGKQFFWDKAAIRYIKNYAQKIDVLNLTHLSQESMLYGFVYKLLNPYGTLYLKLDMDIYHYHQDKIHFSGVPWKEKIYQKLYPFFIEIADVISIETDKARQHLRSLNYNLFKKCIVIPDGINRDYINAEAGKPVFAQKENLILTVGRIGTEQKNSEMLLQALSRIELDPWKAVFVGPVEVHFKPVIESFFKENPHKKDQVLFTGAITDRVELMKYYKRAKIFCLTSRWESFGIVLTEAQCMGDYIIGTDKIPPMDELTRNGELGATVESEDVQSLGRALKEAMKNNFYTEALMQKIVAHNQQYDWVVILEKLVEHLNKANTKHSIH